MERLKPFIIVGDDGGAHPAINWGMRIAAEKGALTCVDYMIEEKEAVSVALSLRNEYPHISVGLHVSIPGINDYAMTALAYWSRWQPNKLLQKRLFTETEGQIKKFQDSFGSQPTHLSTQSDIHMDHYGYPFPWFTELIERLYEGEVSNILVRGIHTIPIRHTRFHELMMGKNPLTPAQFQQMLRNIVPKEDKPVELVVHPAKKTIYPEPKLRAFYTIELREHDLGSLIDIVSQGVIEKAGYEVVSPDKLVTGLS